jgi:hypothetical protein
LFSCRYRCNCWRWVARLIEQHQRQRREQLDGSYLRSLDDAARHGAYCTARAAVGNENEANAAQQSSVANELDVDVVNSGRSATLLTRSSKVLLSIRSLRQSSCWVRSFFIYITIRLTVLSVSILVLFCSVAVVESAIVMQHRVMRLNFITIEQCSIDEQNFIEIQSNSQ